MFDPTPSTQDPLSQFAEVKKPELGLDLIATKSIVTDMQLDSPDPSLYETPTCREQKSEMCIKTGWSKLLTSMEEQVINLFSEKAVLSELPEAQKAMVEAQVPPEVQEDVFEQAKEKLKFVATWCAHEALENAVLHGNKSDPEKTVQIATGFTPAGNFLLWIQDEGPGFRPADVPVAWLDEQLGIATGRGLQTALGLMGHDEWARLWTEESPANWPTELSHEISGSLRFFNSGSGVEFRFGWQRVISEAYTKLKKAS